MSCRQPLDLDAHSSLPEKSAQTSTMTKEEERSLDLQHTPGGDQATTTTPENASMPARPESEYEPF
jgi:hypothetical protein